MKVKAWIFIATVLCASPVSATTISLAVSGDQPVAGSEFKVDVSISDITDLSLIQFDLNFDPSAAVSVASLDPGPLFTDLGANGVDYFFTTLPETDTTIDGIVAGIFAAPVNLLTVDGQPVVFATITFNALVAGQVVLTLSPFNLATDASFPGFVDGDLAPDPLTVVIAGTTDANPVPEPSTMLLLGSGLVATIRKYRRGSTK